MGLEAGVGKRKYLPGVEVAQTPEEKITAGLLEVQHCFASAANALMIVPIGVMNLVTASVGELGPELIVYIQLGLALVLMICCLVYMLRMQPWPRVHMVTARQVAWHAPSNLLALGGASAILVGVAVPIGAVLSQTPGWQPTMENMLGLSAIGLLIGGAFVALSRIAAGLETLAWIKDIRRGEGVVELSTGQRITKQAEQEPQLPSWAQTL
ncbi:MAG TPA: hypothetical protein DIU09_00075 [Hyphomonadaceae bacterium]|nr:hypothetical protein AEM38_09245 [Hyphomonadaceae bacterium UKL13-1]HCP62963.1 hypothetical protein [Hyphomonadaceae bacterium]